MLSNVAAVSMDIAGFKELLVSKNLFSSQLQYTIQRESLTVGKFGKLIDQPIDY